MIELPVYELSPIHLLIVASLFIIILLALMFDRHFEDKKDKDELDRISNDIEID